MNKFLPILVSLLLASCGGGGGGSSSTPSSMTPVTVSLGSVAAGALAATGTIPANVSKALVDAISTAGAVIVSPPVILNTANGFTATIDVPNGAGIRIRVRAFNAAGVRIYEGLSAPQKLIGLPKIVPVTLNVTVAVQATPTSIPRGGVVNLTATTAGGAPSANSPLLWNATGGTLGVPGPNGATNTWTAPNVVGAYSIEAHVDPYANPDQSPLVFGSVTVNVVNQPPVAVNDTATTSAFSPVLINVLLNDSDPDADPLTIVAASNPANGSAVISAGQIQYTPNLGFSGTDTFTYGVSDGLGGVATATVTVTVNAIAVDVGLTKTVNNPAPASGSTVTFTVTATNNSVVSVPGIRVSDALPAGLSLLSATLSQGTYAGGVWNLGALAAGASATLSAITNVLPGNGGVTLTNTASLASVGAGYVDNVLANNSAAASVVPTASADLALTKSVAGLTTPGSTVTYTLSVVNAGPDAANTITVTDPLPVGLTYVSDTGGVATTVVGNTVTWNIPPLANAGTASIDILASIGALASNTPVINSASLNAVTPDPAPLNNSASATFTVGNSLPVITSPATNPYAFTIPEDSPTVSFQLSATDANNDPLTYNPATGAAKGTATVTPNVSGALVSYTPNLNANGPDTFTVPVSDPYGASTLTVNVSITPVNDAPVFSVGPTVSGVAKVGSTLTVSATTTDVDGDPVLVSYQWRANGVNIPGATASSLVVTAQQAHALIDVYALANDQQGQPNSLVSAVSNGLTVANSLPVMTPFGAVANVNEGAVLTLQAVALDADGDPYTFAQGATAPAFATINAAGLISLAPGFADAGTYLMDVYAIDPYGAGAPVPLSIKVNQVNLPPVISSPADPYGFSVNEDSYGNLTVLASDPDIGDTVAYSLYNNLQPVNGTVTVNPTSGAVSYIGKPNFNDPVNPDSFIVAATDSYGAAVLWHINPYVQPVNDAPVFTFPSVNPYAIATVMDTYANFTATASDPDVGDTLTYSIYSAAANGNATIDPYTGAVSYLGNPGFVGSDSFGIQVSDPYALFDQRTVNVTVTAPLSNIWFVDPYSGNDLSAGVDWYSAVQTINMAIQLASPGDEIRVAASDINTAIENVVVNKPNLTLIGNWDPYTNTLLGNIGASTVTALSAGFPTVDIQANGTRIEHLDVYSGFRGFQVDGYSAVLVDSWASSPTDTGLAVLNGATVDVYVSAFESTVAGAGIGAMGPGTVLNLYDVRMSDNYSDGLVALAGAQVNAVKIRSARNYRGVNAQGVGTLVTIDQGTISQNMAVGALFDSYSGGSLKNTMTLGNSEDLNNPFPGSGCGVAAVGGAGNTAIGALAPLTLANVLAEGNNGCGIGVDLYSAMVANSITSIDNDISPNGTNSLVGSPNVYNEGQLTLNRSVVAYHSDGVSTDVYTLAGSTTTLSDSIIGQTIVGTATQTNVQIADPYAFRVVDAYGMVDLYTGQLPYLSQPTGGLPLSPAINAGIITPTTAGLAGLTTDIYGAVDASLVDDGFHFPSGDLDQDLIPDAMENDPYGLAYSSTLTNNPDSDGDGYRDGLELFVYGTDPMDPYSVPAMAVFQPQLFASSDSPGGTFAGASANITAQLLNVEVPLANEPVRFTIQTSPYATFTQNGLQTIDLYTDLSGFATATITDNYAETVPVLVEAVNFAGVSQTVNQLFVSNTGVNTVISVANGNNTISGVNCNTVWDLYGSPYHVQSAVSIAAGCRLQIDPYVIVKFDPGQSLTVGNVGVLDVYGLPGAPVYFTSITDDTVGGDSNGDGGLTTPAAGDWDSISYTVGSGGIMRNAELRYGGGISGSLVVSSSPVIDTVLISDSGTNGLRVNNSSLQVNNLTIKNPGREGIYVGGTSAPVFTGTNSITGVPSLTYASIYLTSVGVNATMSGFTVTGGKYGLDLFGGATASISNTVIEGSALEGVFVPTNCSVNLTNSNVRSNSSWGVYLNGAAVSTIKDNSIVNNGGGVYIVSAAVGTSIENNLIRGNAGVSGFANTNPIRIDAASSPILVRNNLIVENNTSGAATTAGAILVKGNGVSGPTVDLYSNTIAHNKSLANTIPAGLVVDAYATVNAIDNIFAFNTDLAASPTDTQIDPLAASTEDYNLTFDGSLFGVNDVYADPLFTANWYLQAGSPAVNADAVRTAVGVGYLNNNPYTEVNTADIGNLDLGYHHAATAPTVDAFVSTAVPVVVAAGPGGSTDIVITPKDAANALLGAGLKVTAVITPAQGSLGPVRDNGDGTYVITHTHGAGTGTDIVTITVNGVQLATTVQVTW